MEPNVYNFSTKPFNQLHHSIERLMVDHVPLEIFRDGIRVAVAIHPDDYYELTRLKEKLS